MGFLGGSMVKYPSVNVGESGSIPGSERFLGEGIGKKKKKGIGNPL